MSRHKKGVILTIVGALLMLAFIVIGLSIPKERLITMTGFDLVLFGAALYALLFAGFVCLITGIANIDD